MAENALLLRFGATIDRTINARVHAAAQALQNASLPGITDIAPAYASLLLRFDPAAWAYGTRPPHAALGAAVREALQRCAAAPVPVDAPGRCIDIPVCYGGDRGPDLDAVAAHAHLTTAQVVARHTAAAYTVAMLGFAPGFPYLLGLAAALHMPRRATPRKRVPAGSVAIGGAQTGIYPRELPGGWNLIGRTPLILFDPARKPACLLAAGDTVRFHAIDVREFMRLTEPRA